MTSALNFARCARRALPAAAFFTLGVAVAAAFSLGMAVAACGATPAPPTDLAVMTADIRHLEHEWAHIAYEVRDQDEQLKEIDALAKEAAKVVARYPGRAEPLLWDGIITSSEAGMASVFDQLALAGNARTLFERAQAIDPQARNGAVLMSLGVIYYRVPGFPIGFGNNRKARYFLESALAMDPNGLDANYFYGDFLIEQGEDAKARTVLEHALDAQPNPDRPIWDKGRRAEVRALLAKLDQQASP
jgi:tetratricopeptide (TPR) repeat protein